MYYMQDGNTPLHLASENGQCELVEILAKAGADVTITNKVSNVLSVHMPIYT